jgi:molybdate transport system substrate-binding protein
MVISTVSGASPMHRRSFVTTALAAPAALASGAALSMGFRREAAPVRVAAASDLKFAMAEVAQQFEREGGARVQLNMGSSGQFVQQIRQGLPVDLYMSADEDYVFQLAEAGLTRDRGALYALGRIAAIVSNRSELALDAQLRAVAAARASIRHFAIASPEHAPYGRAARQALERLGLWAWAQPKLVLGENVSQATQFVTSGSAQAGITALSLALAPEVARLVRHVLLADHLHAPLRQRMVLLKAARPAAGEFFTYLQAPAARTVLRRFGFAFD